MNMDNNIFTKKWWTETLKLDEYSDKTIRTLVDKFKQEKPNLDISVIQAYINRFDQIKNSPKISEKDIMKYNWKQLETIVDSNQSKRIKAGKINDGEPEDANLIYKQNGLRIYIGKNHKACVKYGNKYSFCISGRGEQGKAMYTHYRVSGRNTPYFIFDDTKTSKKEDEKFIDPTHLLVLLYNKDGTYSITTADNNYGETYYKNFNSIVKAYPRLKGLKDIFKFIDIDPKEQAEYDIISKYNDELEDFIYKDEYVDTMGWETIGEASEDIDDILNNKASIYKFTGNAKPEVSDRYPNFKHTISTLIRSPKDIKIEYNKFVELISMLNRGKDTDDVIKDWEINYEKQDPNDYKDYYEGVKEIVDRYRNELSKLRLMKESIEPTTKLNESQTATIGEFVKYAIKNLGIQKPPRSLTLSYNNAKAKEMSSFGYFDPNNNKIWVYCGNRNMADILRTLAHELVHRKQDEDGRISYESGETGSEIENEANAQAGILLRDFGKQNKDIYEVLLREGVYGDYLWGDKESGVAIMWYDDEKEEDTPAEAELFGLLKKYADSEADVYSNINLDHLIPILKTLKKEYPEIADPQIPGETYIYRGTAVPEEKLNEIMYGAKTEPYTETYDQGIIIMNQTYASRRKVQSWSTNYHNAAGFAVTTAEKKGGVPVIMRSKAKYAELFFKPEFMDKLSTQLEDETFNITNPIPVDIMVLENYKDEFEDIEAGYIHTKQK